MKYIGNVKVIKVSRFLTKIGIFDIEYDFTKVYSKLKESKLEDEKLSQLWTSPLPLSPTILPTKISFGLLKTNIVCTTIDNDFNSLYLFCMASKQTHVVVQSKLIIKIDEKLDKVHVNLWEPHYFALLSRKSHVAIFLNAKTRKI